MIKNKKVYIRANDKYREKINKERGENKKSIYIEFPAKELMVKTHENDCDPNDEYAPITIKKIIGAINCRINPRIDEETSEYSYCAYLAYTQNPNEYLLLASHYRIITFEMPEHYKIMGFMKSWTSLASQLYFCGIIVHDAKNNKNYFVVVPTNDENNKCIEIKDELSDICGDYEKYFSMIDDCDEQFIPDFILNKKYFYYKRW